MAMATKALRLLEYISHCILRIVLILIARKMQEGHACWALSFLDNAGHFQWRIFRSKWITTHELAVDYLTKQLCEDTRKAFFCSTNMISKIWTR